MEELDQVEPTGLVMRLTPKQLDAIVKDTRLPGEIAGSYGVSASVIGRIQHRARLSKLHARGVLRCHRPGGGIAMIDDRDFRREYPVLKQLYDRMGVRGRSCNFKNVKELDQNFRQKCGLKLHEVQKRDGGFWLYYAGAQVATMDEGILVRVKAIKTNPEFSVTLTRGAKSSQDQEVTGRDRETRKISPEGKVVHSDKPEAHINLPSDFDFQGGDTLTLDIGSA